MSETSNATGRNDPCPCASGKKYKKCCGFNVAPVLPAALEGGEMGEMPSPIPGFDPSTLSPEWIQQVSTAFARLPKGQRLKLQSVISRAMAGKDVSRESEDLEKNLPVELQSLLNSAPVPDSITPPEGSDPKAEAEAAKSTKFWRKIFKKK